MPRDKSREQGLNVNMSRTTKENIRLSTRNSGQAGRNAWDTNVVVRIKSHLKGDTVQHHPTVTTVFSWFSQDSNDDAFLFSLGESSGYHLCASVGCHGGGRHRAHLWGDVVQAGVRCSSPTQFSVHTRVGNHSKWTRVGAGHCERCAKTRS